jgi:hypothetical protein
MKKASLLLALLTAACSEQNVGKVNQAPTAAIVAPPNDSSVDEGTIVTLAGNVSDDYDPYEALRVRWASDKQGVLVEDLYADSAGTTIWETANLDPGTHIITLSVWDTDAKAGSDAISLTVRDLPDAPSIEIVRPMSGEEGEEGFAFTYEAQVWDVQDAVTDVLVSFESSIDGEFCTPTPDRAGYASCDALLSPGRHLLTFTAMDTSGLSDSATTYFTVLSGDAVDNDGDGYSENQGDCDDTNRNIHPNASERANGFDDDCDGLIDEGTDVYDDDGDGFSENAGDCDDADATTWPGAPERYDMLDNDCDGVVDEGTEGYDDDGDGYAQLGGDCDDASAGVHPGAAEVWDGVDQDCDGIVDEGTMGYDDDGDGWSEADGDCNDAHAGVYPTAPESYDLLDNDCDGVVDEGTEGYDDDGDGYTELTGDCDDGYVYTYPGAVELEDGRDNDCDGTTDEGTAAYDDDGDGYSERAGDCNDANPSIRPGATEACDGVDNDCDSSVDEEGASGCITYYYDYDGDAYGSSSISGRCLCSSTGYWTSRYRTDCYDYNSAANPSATTYMTSHRGDGSYDWNCDGVETRYWAETYSCDDFWALPPCDLNHQGWRSGVASCGSSASYVTNCSIDLFSCSISTTTRTQKCL